MPVVGAFRINHNAAGGCGVACVSGGQAFGLALGFLPSGAAEAPGSGPARQGRRAAVPEAALRPEERSRTMRDALRVVSGGVSRLLFLIFSGGCLAVQELGHCLGGGLPAQRLAGPAVQLVGDLLQLLRVGRQVGALGKYWQQHQ
jgi:hypothetical protein